MSLNLRRARLMSFKESYPKLWRHFQKLGMCRKWSWRKITSIWQISTADAKGAWSCLRNSEDQRNGSWIRKQHGSALFAVLSFAPAVRTWICLFTRPTRELMWSWSPVMKASSMPILRNDEVNPIQSTTNLFFMWIPFIFFFLKFKSNQECESVKGDPHECDGQGPCPWPWW